MIKKLMLTGLAAAALAAPASAQSVDPGTIINAAAQIYNAVRANSNPYYYNSPYYNNGYYVAPSNGYYYNSYPYTYSTPYYNTYSTPYYNNYYYNNGYYTAPNSFHRYYIDRDGNRVWYK